MLEKLFRKDRKEIPKELEEGKDALVDRFSKIGFTEEIKYLDELRNLGRYGLLGNKHILKFTGQILDSIEIALDKKKGIQQQRDYLMSRGREMLEVYLQACITYCTQLRDYNESDADYPGYTEHVHKSRVGEELALKRFAEFYLEVGLLEESLLLQSSENWNTGLGLREKAYVFSQLGNKNKARTIFKKWYIGLNKDERKEIKEKRDYQRMFDCIPANNNHLVNAQRFCLDEILDVE